MKKNQKIILRKRGKKGKTFMGRNFRKAIKLFFLIMLVI